MKKIILLAIVLFLMVINAEAQSSNRQILSSMHKNLNEICRGGSGDYWVTNEACDVRTNVSNLLKTINKGKTESNGRQALNIYKKLNEMCRGGSGDRNETNQACDVRHEASKLLKNLGYCWRGDWWKKCRSR